MGANFWLVSFCCGVLFSGFNGKGAQPPDPRTVQCCGRTHSKQLRCIFLVVRHMVEAMNVHQSLSSSFLSPPPLIVSVVLWADSRRTISTYFVLRRDSHLNVWCLCWPRSRSNRTHAFFPSWDQELWEESRGNRPRTRSVLPSLLEKHSERPKVPCPTANGSSQIFTRLKILTGLRFEWMSHFKLRERLPGSQTNIIFRYGLPFRCNFYFISKCLLVII